MPCRPASATLQEARHRRRRSPQAQTTRPRPGSPSPKPARLDMPRAERLGLEEEQQVVRAARLGIGAAHVEAAEWVHANQGSGTLPIEVQIADVELTPRPRETIRVATVQRAGQSEFGRVRNCQRVVEVARTDECENRTEDF